MPCKLAGSGTDNEGMMMTIQKTLLISLALVGCDTSGDLPAYYQGGPAPAPSALSQHSENGNVGGDVVRIVGENFGGNPDGVTVVFGSQNASIISVGNDEIVARVPMTPILDFFVTSRAQSTAGVMTS